MERRALIAVVISIAILLLYQEIVLKRMYPPLEPGEQAPPPIAKMPEVEPPPEAPPTDDPYGREEPVRGAEVTVETDLYRAVFTAAGARLKSFQLKEYRVAPQRDSPAVEMVTAGGKELPLGIELRGPELHGAGAISDIAALYEVRGRSVQLAGAEQADLTFVWKRAGLELEKRFRFIGDRYPISMDVVVRAVPSGVTELGLQWVHAVEGVHSGYYSFAGAVAVVANKLVKVPVDSLEESAQQFEGPIDWAGYADTYFLSAILPERSEEAGLWMRRRGGEAETRVVTSLAGPSEHPFQLYVGPKNFDILEAVDPTLARAVDFGWFAFIAIPFLHALNLLHGLTGNYGVDIILLTLAIKILFIPLTQKSFKSMKELQKLQPQMQRLREKYKDKPDEMQREMMELYRRHKVNPIGGCLPMLLQFPVFIGLYNTLLSAIELRHAPFALWINDLSQPDRLGGLAIPFVAPPGIPVLTLLMGGSMFVQQWISPSAGDPTQQRMMMIMPLVFTVIFINVPSGLVLYWLVNNVLTIAQQYAMLRKSE